MRYFLIAGEKSGDEHAAGLVKSLLNNDAEGEVRGIGGDAMTSEGVKLLFHYQEIAIMGFIEVVENIFRLRRLINSCKKDIIDFHPDIVILIDSAGFNLRIAKYAQKRGHKVHYFIPPKVWAWGSWRIKTLKRSVHCLYSILPFEQEYFKNKDLEVAYFGWPSKDWLTPSINQNDFGVREGAIAFLPGSRRQEISRHLPVLLSVARMNPDLHFIIWASDSVPETVFESVVLPENVKLLYSAKEEIKRAKVAIVASGTATLEMCLLGIPQIVIYKTGLINYLLARVLIKVNHISLPNLIAGKKVVLELIQRKCNPELINQELKKILKDTDYRQRMTSEYQEIRERILKENVYDKIARDMIERINLSSS